MKLIVFLALICCFNLGTSQLIDFCGELSPHQASTTNPDSIYEDRFGNTYDMYHPNNVAVAPEVRCTTTNYFILVFDMAIDVNFRNVICHVFEDLGNSMPRNTNNLNGCGEELKKEYVIIKIIPRLDAGFIAAASPWFAAGNGKCSENKPMNVSEINSIINGGHDHATFINTNTEHGRIEINTSYNFNLDYDNAPTNGTIDLRSVIMHEALHLYGFTSNIESDGTPIKGAYDVYDNFIHIFNDQNQISNKVIIGDCNQSCCTSNCWKLNPAINDFEQMVRLNCDGMQSDNFGFGNPLIAYLHGSKDYPSGATFLNYLSHLSTDCNGIQNDLIVMKPFIEKNIRRVVLSEAEKKILCMIGYNVLGFECNPCAIVAYDERYLYPKLYSCCTKKYYTCVGNPITFNINDLLCNDVGNSREIIDIFKLTNSFTFTRQGDVITFLSQEQGDHKLYYTVKNCTTCKMDNAFIEIGVGPCLDCSQSDPCILNCLGTFEEFSQLWQTGIPVFSLTGLDYWIFKDKNVNSPDICLETNTNNYIQLHSGVGEAIAVKLNEPIKPGCKAIISFKGSTSTISSSVVILGSKYPPCAAFDSPINIGCVPTNCNNSPDYSPICIRSGFPINNITGNIAQFCPTQIDFANYSLEFPNIFSGSEEINYIIFYPQNPNSLTYIYLDDIEVRKDCSCAMIGQRDILCDQIEFTAIECESDNEYQWDFGDKNTSMDNPTTHTFASNGIFTVTLLVTDKCGNTSSDIKIVNVNCDGFSCDCPGTLDPPALPNSFCKVFLNSKPITEIYPDPLKTSINGCCVIVKGKVKIDKDFTINHCTVVMEPGAEFEVQSGKKFTIENNSELQGCIKMWKSVTCLNGSYLKMTDSNVQDAEFGIRAKGGSTIQLVNNFFLNNYVGVFADGGVINNSSPMIDNGFSSAAGFFLPPYSGQVNIPGDYGYCGVLLRNAVFSVGAKGAVNYFSSLYNGIIAFNSDVTVTNAYIDNLITVRSRLIVPPKFTYPDGDGIFADQSFITAQANTILNTNGSITDYRGKSLIAYDNIISNTVSGIYCAFPQLEVYLDKNEITNFHLYGIGVTSPKGKINLMITRTNPCISNTSTGSGSRTGIFLENVIAKGLAQVHQNVMTLDPYALGIVLRSSQKIGLQENIGSYSGITNRNGIELATSHSNTVYNNTISNSSSISTQGNAFYINDSRSNNICCNNSSGTRSGFHFANTSTMPDQFRTNQISNHRIGLECDNVTSIELQRNCGNRWNGNYNNYSASHLGDQFFRSLSRFHVNNCSNAFWPKNPLLPNQGCNPIDPSNLDWFQYDGDGSSVSCTSDLICKKPFSTIRRVIRGTGTGLGEGFSEDAGLFNSNDTILATDGFIGNNNFETRTLWEMSYDLLFRLKTHPIFLEENSIMNSFVLSNDTTNLGKFVNVALRLDTLITYTESEWNQLEYHLYTLDSARIQIEYIDSLFGLPVNEEDSLIMVNQRMNWSLQINNSKLSIDTILTEHASIRALALQGLVTFISSITPSNIIESNHKTILTIYLNTLINGIQELTTTQMASVMSVANSCSRSGGRSVILARQLYQLHENLDFDDDTLCQPEPEPLILGTGSSNNTKLQLNVYPNPNNGNFVIEIKNRNIPSNSKLYIFDLNGKEVFNKLILTESQKIVISRGEIGMEGVFICKLISCDGLLYSPKIVLKK